MNHIILYADEFNTEEWEEYCRIARVSASSKVITINFEPKNVEASNETEFEEDMNKSELTEALSSAISALLDSNGGCLETVMDYMGIKDEHLREKIKVFMDWEEEED